MRIHALTERGGIPLTVSSRLVSDLDGGVGYLLKDRGCDVAAFGTDMRKAGGGKNRRVRGLSDYYQRLGR